MPLSDKSLTDNGGAKCISGVTKNMKFGMEIIQE